MSRLIFYTGIAISGQFESACGRNFLLIMNTTLGTGDLQLSEGFLAWHKWVSENPDLGAGRLAASEVVSAWDSTINNLMTIALPLAMFEEMQCNLAGSFLERPTWQSLVKNK